MVCLSVPRLGFQPTQCLARPMLFAALACYDAGDYIGCGVRLREAVKRFVVSACEWYGVTVKGKYPSPSDLARALRKAKQLDKWGLEILLESIEVGNKAAHCGKVDRDTLRGGIALVFAMMDSEPYTPHDRTPIDSSHKTDPYEIDDCDDDDHGDDWKKGVPQ